MRLRDRLAVCDAAVDTHGTAEDKTRGSKTGRGFEQSNASRDVDSRTLIGIRLAGGGKHGGKMDHRIDPMRPEEGCYRVRIGHVAGNAFGIMVFWTVPVRAEVLAVLVPQVRTDEAAEEAARPRHKYQPVISSPDSVTDLLAA